MNDKRGIILFHTSSHAIRAEKILKREGIPCKLIPVPRHLGSDCGVCTRVPHSDLEAAQRVLDEARVEIVGIHEI